MTTPQPLLDATGIDQLRTALSRYTVDSLQEAFGLSGHAMLSPDDLAGVARRVPSLDDQRLATLVRLFLLAEDVPEADARTALDPLPLAAAAQAGFVALSAGAVRAELHVLPYAEGGSGTSSHEPWWVVSDFSSLTRPGPLPADHVLGVGSATRTLAQATPRAPVGDALDLGTGCGAQALHLGRHADRVTATDISPRALRLAATTAALSAQTWRLLPGSFAEPVRGETFDLIVCNPPFVVSDGTSEYDYRDSGLAGDAVCRDLISELPQFLAPGGTAQLLANWIVPADGDWGERIAGWIRGRGCDAWVWQRQVAEPAEYVAQWLRDAGEVPGTPRGTRRYNAWLDWFAEHDVVAVGMGLVTMWRTDRAEPVLVFDDVPQSIEPPAGMHVSDWIERVRWLAGRSDEALLATPLRAAPDLVLVRESVLDGKGWTTAVARMRQTHAMRWEVEVDEPIAALVSGCDGNRPVQQLVTVLAAALDRPTAELAETVLPVCRDMIQYGFLLPPAPA